VTPQSDFVMTRAEHVIWTIIDAISMVVIVASFCIVFA
jgi:hypothetical protein